ncbi:RNA recognition motif. (a.k.a. RRM, RBD, or RNP domain), putative [Angomonas deanei]|uniref:RNA recognition motif. (A.k.a. RRM, RBD, or RNP domain), putative n=1 Tax=Angomonas deanei TaxID=59799 RepID=A0A7G2CF38_9TRYP|nr:RNA recognition motif. (a.k.a. RRM, RBD, or RNP domain), putative [Angomonas deanei]
MEPNSKSNTNSKIKTRSPERVNSPYSGIVLASPEEANIAVSVNRYTHNNNNRSGSGTPTAQTQTQNNNHNNHYENHSPADSLPLSPRPEGSQYPFFYPPTATALTIENTYPIRFHFSPEIQKEFQQSNLLSEDLSRQFDAPEKYSNTNLFFRHLPFSLTEKELNEVFSQFGTIISSAIMRNIHTGESLGTAFVRYEKPEEARAAAIALHKKRIFFNLPDQNNSNYNNRNNNDSHNNKSRNVITMEWARQRYDHAIQENEKEKIRKLFIRNIPLGLMEEDLLAWLAPYGEIQSLRLHADTAPSHNNQNQNNTAQRNVVFVTFVHDGSAKRACDAVHGTLPFPSCDGIALMGKLAEDNDQRKLRRASRDKSQHQIPNNNNNNNNNQSYTFPSGGSHYSSSQSVQSWQSWQSFSNMNNNNNFTVRASSGASSTHVSPNETPGLCLYNNNNYNQNQNYNRMQNMIPLPRSASANQQNYNPNFPNNNNNNNNNNNIQNSNYYDLSPQNIDPDAIPVEETITPKVRRHTCSPPPEMPPYGLPRLYLYNQNNNNNQSYHNNNNNASGYPAAPYSAPYDPMTGYPYNANHNSSYNNNNNNSIPGSTGSPHSYYVDPNAFSNYNNNNNNNNMSYNSNSSGQSNNNSMSGRKSPQAQSYRHNPYNT